MIHYHGTPLTPRSELMKLAGKHFCVSFARPDDAGWCMAHAQSIMWDNGAFSAYTRREPFRRDEYIEWLEHRLQHPNWCVVPDKIDGTIDEQRAMIAGWPYRAELSAPVWHMGLGIDWLLELADTWPRICFGSSGRYWQVGSDDWCRRADEAWNALERRGTRPWVHMLRGMALAGDKWPFASLDSVNVARNFKNTRTCPERMARRIDSAQSPLTWHMAHEQLDAFSEQQHTTEERSDEGT